MKAICMTVAFVVLVAFIKADNSLIKRSSWKTSDESSRMLKAINKYARRQMMDLIPSEMSSMTGTYEISFNLCTKKIHKASEACSACANKKKAFWNAMCATVLTNLKKAASWLGKYISLPFVEAGKLIEDIVGKLKDTLKDLGRESVKFLKDLGRFTEKLGNDLLKGAGDVVRKAVAGLKKVGKELIKIGDDVATKIGNGVKDITKEIGNTLEDIGRETGNLMKDIGKGVGNVAKDFGKGVGNVAKDFGKGVGNVAKDFGKGVESLAKDFGKGVKKTFFKPIGRVWRGFSRTISGWFGKRDLERMRRTCSMSCEVCNKLDNRKHSNEQIVTNICGPEMSALQKRIIKVQNNLKTLIGIIHASRSPSHGFSIIKSIRYDRDSDNVEEDAYTENFITYGLNATHQTFKSKTVLDTWNIPKTGKSIGNQIMSRIRQRDFDLE